MEMEVRLFLQEMVRLGRDASREQPQASQTYWDGYFNCLDQFALQAQDLLDKYTHPMVEEGSRNVRGMTYG